MKRLSILFFIVIGLALKAQPPSNFYTKFGGAGLDIAYGVKVTLDRQYIVVGSTSSFGLGNTDVYLTKVDSMGNPIWGKTFGGFNNEIGKSIVQLSDSGYVIAGFTNSFGNGGYDAFIIRTDKMGNLIWQTTYGGTDWDFAYDIVQASDGNLVICGTTNSFGNGKRDGFMLKYDIAGTLIWQKFYGGIEDDELNALINTNDNFLATIGYTKSKGEINGDIYLLKIDLNGDTLFTKTYGGAGKDYGTDLVQKAYDEYNIVGAKTYTSSHTESVMYKIGVNGSLNEENSFYSSGTADEHWTAVSNSYAGVGHTAFLRNIPVASFKSQGNVFVCIASLYPYLVNSYGGGEDEIMYGIDKTKDGGYVSVGATNSYSAQNTDAFLIKQDSFLVNYQSLVGIKESLKASTRWTLKNYGNNDYEVETVSDAYKSAIITDIYGRVVKTIAIENNSAKFSLNEFSNGTYIISLRSPENKTITFKLIKV